MRRLIDLYPRAWRDRYADEFGALLAARPPDLGDRLDIVRGALDARIHPQVGDSPKPDPVPASLRISAGVASIGGILWILAGAVFVATPIDGDLGYKETTLPILLTVGAALLTGQLAVAVTRHVRRGVSGLSVTTAVMVLGAIGLLLPWPILALGFYGLALGTMGFAFLLTGRVGRPAILLGLSAFASLLFNTESATALILVAPGAAWILLASEVWLRGLAGDSLHQTRATE